jgi:OPA family sugar phosphate sensor protein UhpC-like MFS transporter
MMAETTMEKVKPAAVAIKGRTGLSLGQLSSLMWIYWAYVLCYLLRKNYPLLLPNLAAAELLTTSQAGIVASVFEAVVGVVKLVCGVWVDRAASPAKLLSGCLAVAGGSCLAMQATFWLLAGKSMGTARLVLVAIFWSANGAGQAVAWPALAKVFMAWFPDPKTRGFWYSMLATNQNFGGSAAPRIFPPMMRNFGWASALYVPSILTLGYSGAQFACLRDKPAAPAAAAAPAAPGPAKAKPPSPGLIETFAHLTKMRPFVALCAGYIPIMLLRQSLTNWTAVMFGARGLSLAKAAGCMSALELGGFAGGLCPGPPGRLSALSVFRC